MCSTSVRSQPRLASLRLTGAAALLLLTNACGGHYVVRGASLYDAGHFVEAAEVFEQTEERLANSSNAERARFGLYRGATFLKLGDVPHAVRWLGYSRSVLNRDPSALGSDDAALLDASLSAVGHVDSRAPERKERAEMAAAPAPGIETAPAQ
jgi:hypothetical protein